MPEQVILSDYGVLCFKFKTAETGFLLSVRGGQPNLRLYHLTCVAIVPQARLGDVICISPRTEKKSESIRNTPVSHGSLGGVMFSSSTLLISG
jgi:hypothetical protein